MTRIATIALTLLVLAAGVSAATGTVDAVAPSDPSKTGADTAEDATEEVADADADDDDNRPIVNIDLGPVTGALEDLIATLKAFTGGENLADILTRVIFYPFLLLGKAILDFIIALLMVTPDVHPNPAVEEVYRQTLLAAIGLSSLGILWSGITLILGEPLGLSTRQAKHVLPRLLAALIFSMVGLHFLQLTVEFTNLLVDAFRPHDLVLAFTEMAGMVSGGLVLSWAVNSVLLLVVAAAFIIRNVYIMFIAAISPLIAVAWAIPGYPRRMADTFIGSYITALAMGPLDVLVLRFAIALYEGNGVTLPVDNWIYGTAALILLLLVPFQLYGASQSIVGMGYAVAGGISSKAKDLSKQNQQKAAHKPLEPRDSALGSTTAPPVRHSREPRQTSSSEYTGTTYYDD